MAKKITIIGTTGTPDVSGVEVLIEDTVDQTGVSFGLNELQPAYTKNYTRVTIRRVSDGVTVIGTMDITSIINGNTNVAFWDGDEFRAFVSKSFFRKAGGGGSSLPATSAEIINASHTAFWGDSLTQGYPTYLSAIPIDYSSLTGKVSYNGGITGETSTQIKNRMIAMADKYGWSAVIWAGRNNYADATAVKADIATMVAALGHTRYLVLSVLKASNEITGTAAQIAIDALNVELSTIYGNNYYDVQAWLKTQGDGSANDNADIANGIIPRSLRSPADPIHLAVSTNKLIAAQLVTKTILNSTVSSPIAAKDSAAGGLYGSKQFSLSADGQYQLGGIQVLAMPNAVDITLHNNLIVGDGGKLLTGIGLANTIAGLNAFISATTAVSCAIFGESSGKVITTAARESGFGQHVLEADTTGTDNTGVGYTALFTTSTGRFNTAVGSGAGKLATGNSGVFIGYNAGSKITSAANCIVIGNNLDTLTNNTTAGQMNIGGAIIGVGINGSGTTLATGNIGVFVAAPTARFHLPPGAAAAGKAPIKLTTGISLTVAEDGALEYDGTNLYFTVGSTRKTVTLI